MEFHVIVFQVSAFVTMFFMCFALLWNKRAKYPWKEIKLNWLFYYKVFIPLLVSWAIEYRVVLLKHAIPENPFAAIGAGILAAAGLGIFVLKFEQIIRLLFNTDKMAALAKANKTPDVSKLVGAITIVITQVAFLFFGKVIGPEILAVLEMGLTFVLLYLVSKFAPTFMQAKNYLYVKQIPTENQS
jgi:hypothetical protein